MEEINKQVIVIENYVFKTLKLLMKKNKITQFQLCEKLKISPITLRRYFKKQTQIPLEIYLKIILILKSK